MQYTYMYLVTLALSLLKVTAVHLLDLVTPAPSLLYPPTHSGSYNTYNFHGSSTPLHVRSPRGSLTSPVGAKYAFRLSSFTDLLSKSGNYPYYYHQSWR